MIARFPHVLRPTRPPSCIFFLPSASASRALARERDSTRPPGCRGVAVARHPGRKKISLVVFFFPSALSSPVLVAPAPLRVALSLSRAIFSFPAAWTVTQMAQGGGRGRIFFSSMWGYGAGNKRINGEFVTFLYFVTFGEMIFSQSKMREYVSIGKCFSLNAQLNIPWNFLEFLLFIQFGAII